MISWQDKQRIYIQRILGIEPPLDDTDELLAYRRMVKPMYCVTNDLYLSFGKANIIKWADVDNNKDNTAIQARIAWAIENSTNWFDAKLADSPYQFPLAIMDPYPPILVKHCAALAAVMLYESRGITDRGEHGKPLHSLSWHRDAVEEFCRDVYARRIQIPGAILNADAVDISTAPDFVPLGSIDDMGGGFDVWNKWQ